MLKENMIQAKVYQSEDGKNRFALEKVWDDKGKKAAVVMISPNKDVDGIYEDMTTLYCTNNLYKLGYGSMFIVNLYSLLGAESVSKIKMTKAAIKQNDEIIVEIADQVDHIIIAVGSLTTSNKEVKDRYWELLGKLKKHREKLLSIEGKHGRTGFHPLCSEVRLSWKLAPMKGRDDIGK